MLTAEEQWKILQDLERRNGRGKRREKTLAEQLKEMGGFGKDPDSEEALWEEINRDDTRAPLQQSQASDSECEPLVGESSFWVSRTRLFRSWIFQAKRPPSWIQEKDLPLFFRFALGRPIMDELSFQYILKALDLRLDESTGRAGLPSSKPVGRSGKLLLGIDPDLVKPRHPSHTLKDILPRGAAEDADGAWEAFREIVQDDDEDMRELLQTQLRAVYKHVQNGSVPLESATWHYRDAFDKQNMSDETLVLCLQHFSIPTDHITINEQKSPQGSSHCQSPSSEESEKITLRNYVGLYRSGMLLEDEAIQMIRDCLYGLKIDPDLISEILNDLEKDEGTAASLIWEDTCAEEVIWEDTCAEEDDEYMASSSSSDEDNKPYGDHGNSLRAVMIPDPLANDGKDQIAAVSLPVDEINPPGRTTTEDLDNRDGFNEEESHKSEAIMEPPAMLSGKLPIHSGADKARGSTLPPGTPRPASVLSVTETLNSQGHAALDREPPSGRTNIGRRRTSSPDEGMTTGLWGLPMRTEEARRLAYKLKLPQNCIDEQICSISPSRERRRRATYAENVVTLPKSKRKASIVLHRGTAPKSPKHDDHSYLFAREGEDQENFVLSHFVGDESPVPACDKCLSLCCQCGNKSSQVDKAAQAAPCKGNLSSDGPVTKLVDRTRADPPKQSVTLLTYLARVLDDKDVLASIRQLEWLPKTVEVVSYAKKVRHHIKQAICDGERLVVAGMEDREVVRILHHLVESSGTLANHSKKLHHETKEEDDSTISVNNCHDESQEGPDKGLGLRNSSPDHEHVHVPPSDHISNAAVSPEKQSEVANDAVFQANNTPPAKGVSPYLPTAAPEAPDSGVSRLKSNSGSEDAAQPSRFQTATAPDPSTAGDSSRSEIRSRSPGGCKNSPAGGHSSQTKFSPESSAGCTFSSTAELSGQVSDNPVGAEGDTDDTSGAPFTKSPSVSGSSDGKIPLSLLASPAAKPPDDNDSPQSPKANAKQLTSNTPPPSQSPPLKQSCEDVPSATSTLGSREMSRDSKATHRLDSPSPGFENLPIWPPKPGLPGKDRLKWKGMTSNRALDRAKKKAFRERKSLAFYLEGQRAVRTRIKRENDLANSKWSDHSFFQGTNGSSGSSGFVTTQALNKLFDKYRGTSNIHLRSRTQPY